MIGPGVPSPMVRPSRLTTAMTSAAVPVRKHSSAVEMADYLSPLTIETYVECRVTPLRTEVIIRATRTQNVLGDKGRRIRELTSVVQKRWNFAENSVELYAEKVAHRGQCAGATLCVPCNVVVAKWLHDAKKLCGYPQKFPHRLEQLPRDREPA